MIYIFSCLNKHQYDVEMPMGEDWKVLCPECNEWGEKDRRANFLSQTFIPEFHKQWHYDEHGQEVPDEPIRRMESRQSELSEWRKGNLKGKLVIGPAGEYIDPEVG